MTKLLLIYNDVLLDPYLKNVKDDGHVSNNYDVTIVNAKVWPKAHGELPAADIVVVWNALEFYLRNRFALKGRPFVVASSWHLDDLYSLIGSSLSHHDAGIDLLLTNCKMYVEQSSAIAPTVFMFRPQVLIEEGCENVACLGAYIPSTEDRDLSQIVLTRKLVPDPARFVIIAPPQLHDILEPYKLQVHYLLPNQHLYCDFKWFVPAPKLTDYRYRITPPEIMQAIASGCTPWLIVHPSLHDIAPYITPMIGSLRAYEQACADPSKFNVQVSLPKELQPTLRDFFDTIRRSQQRGKPNAVAT